MREAHQITLILPEGMCLSDFNKIMSESLKSSNFEYVPVSGFRGTMEDLKKLHLETKVKACEYDLVPIAGRDMVMEFMKVK